MIAEALAKIASRCGVPLIFKASVRQGEPHVAEVVSRARHRRGAEGPVGRSRSALGVPILTDIHEANQAAPVAEVADVLQIPAFLSRQTDLIVAAAKTGRTINLKKGQFLAPGRHEPRDCEGRRRRETLRCSSPSAGFSFGYNNLVVDMRAFPMLRSLGYPVVYDATHSLQLPGGGDGVTAGQAEYIEPLASAAVAAGIDGLFLEVHDDPPRAKSDAQNALPLERVEPLLRHLMRIDAAAREAGVAAIRGSDPLVIATMTQTRPHRPLARAQGPADRGCCDPGARRSRSTRGSTGRSACSTSARGASSSPAWASPASSAGRSRRRWRAPARRRSFFIPPKPRTAISASSSRSDLLLAISHSGETQEVLRLLEAIRRIGANIVAITGNPASTLAQAADVALDCQVSEEACPLNLVPTASTTAALAMGDALCMTLLVEKGFREEDFAKIHPGGKLGKKLMRVDQLMHGGADAPIVTTDTPMRDVISEISKKALGMTCVVDAADELVGIITDGDLRRHMVDNARLFAMTAGDIMTRRPIVIDPSTLAAQALLIMEQRKITSLVVGGTTRASRACCTFTISGGQSCFERLLPFPRRARLRFSSD